MAALNEEQTIIKEQARSWATERAPVGKFRAMRDRGNELGYDQSTWNEMVEMGWTGVIIPEEFGGLGLGYLTFGVILEELGRQLTASPLFASAFVGASAVVMGGNTEHRSTILPKVVDGSEILTLAVDEGPRHSPEQVSLQAKKTASGYKLTGNKTFVPEGMAVTSLIVVARTSGAAGDTSGITLFVVPASSNGISRKAMQTFDSRGYARIAFDDVEVDADAVLGEIDQGFGLLDAVLDRARAGIGAEMIGVGSQSFDMTLEYLKTREQFGKVIGSFQALGHMAAELYSSQELARSCAEGALQAIDANADSIARMCSLSKAQVGDFLNEVTRQLIQVHGGIGMTDEFDAGLYLKRARPLETIYGSRSYHRDRYATLLGF